MKDFYELPERSSYGVFLIRDPKSLNLQSLIKLQTENQRLILSFERLFKGSKSALVLYAPRDIITKFSNFKPLELLDYSKNKGKSVNDSKSGEVWRQFVIQPGKDGFKVEKRELQVASKMDPQILSDYRKRKITLLGQQTLNLSAEQLLSAILLPQ